MFKCNVNVLVTWIKHKNVSLAQYVYHSKKGLLYVCDSVLVPDFFKGNYISIAAA